MTIRALFARLAAPSRPDTAPSEAGQLYGGRSRGKNPRPVGAAAEGIAPQDRLSVEVKRMPPGVVSAEAKVNSLRQALQTIQAAHDRAAGELVEVRLEADETAQSAAGSRGTASRFRTSHSSNSACRLSSSATNLKRATRRSWKQARSIVRVSDPRWLRTTLERSAPRQDPWQRRRPDGARTFGPLTHPTRGASRPPYAPRRE